MIGCAVPRRHWVSAIDSQADAAWVAQLHVHGMPEQSSLRGAARGDHLEQVPAAGCGELHPAVLDCPQADVVGDQPSTAPQPGRCRSRIRTGLTGCARSAAVTGYGRW